MADEIEEDVFGPLFEDAVNVILRPMGLTEEHIEEVREGTRQLFQAWNALPATAAVRDETRDDVPANLYTAAPAVLLFMLNRVYTNAANKLRGGGEASL